MRNDLSEWEQRGVYICESLADSPIPPPERRATRHVRQAVAILAILVSIGYLTWRGVATLNLSVWWLSVPLLVLEAHAVMGLALFTVSLWNLDALTPTEPVDHTDARVAVLIPTYDEPREVLLPSIAAAVALRPAHRTYVLDDGRRPWVAELARALGADYLARPDDRGAKAGNINAALGHIDADVIAVLDADHVASPNLLRHTLGYFADPRIALVQTPQDFYNVESFEHAPLRRGRYSEQALFYRAIQAGRNRWAAAFWCGTGALVRVEALRSVGGIATETVTEDIHTTIRLHATGWRTVYHNEVLARGLAAADAEQYLAQRVRWGSGAMQVLRRDNPAIVGGLAPMQRLSHLTTLLGWFDAWRTLGYVLTPMAVLAVGVVPIRAPWGSFALWFGTTFVAQRLALRALSRGYAPGRFATLFDFVRLPANLTATLTLFRRGALPFRVTAKGARGSARRQVRPPRLLLALQLLSVAVGAWYIATRLGLTPLRYRVPLAEDVAAGWLALNAVILAAAVRRISSPRFARERRASVRFMVDLDGEFGGRPVHVVDVSLTGAQVECAGAAPSTGTLRLGIGGGIELGAHVRSARPMPDGRSRLGLEFTPDQLRAQTALALALFDHGYDPATPQPLAAAG